MDQSIQKKILFNFEKTSPTLCAGGKAAANIHNEEGSSPLHTVLRHTCGQCSTRPALRCIRALLKGGADATICDRWGDPVVFEAARHLPERPELMCAIISSAPPALTARNSRNDSLDHCVMRCATHYDDKNRPVILFSKLNLIFMGCFDPSYIIVTDVLAKTKHFKRHMHSSPVVNVVDLS